MQRLVQNMEIMIFNVHRIVLYQQWKTQWTLFGTRPFVCKWWFWYFRIAENVGEIHRLRAPRRFYKDNIVRPYNKQEAEGCAILAVSSCVQYLTVLYFIIYPSMYCSKYRPYQAVEYKPADRIFRITTVWFSESVSCLSDV